MPHTKLFPLLWLILLLLGGCSLAPNWKALYEPKLGQPVEEIHTASLNARFTDEDGNVTRVSWARLANGSLVLLGLPSAGLPPQEVVDRTVVLPEHRLRLACEAAVGRPVYGWGWGTSPSRIGNTFTVKPNFQKLEVDEMITTPDPNAPYCQFVFLPHGWEVRVVQNKGPV
ncbi:MAG: hypothetical protein MUD01_12495 [Chloroflexaceae bacterium]|jgi:hypothetical protein|nr:hypothetical protein [Chloroflexaceae bacterium]